MKKVDRNQWFVIGLNVLENDGYSKITIDNLCALLKITKGAFYHHFKNIDGYVDALMKYWLEVNTFEFIREVTCPKIALHSNNYKKCTSYD